MAADIKFKGKPEILFEENREKFNKLVSEGKHPDLRNCNISDLDLRGFNLTSADLRGCYLKGTTLAGQDLSNAKLDGASLKNAHISGCLFPYDLSAHEIDISHRLGTRIRHRKDENEPNK